MSRSNINVIFLFFFYWKRVVHFEFALSGQAINKEFCLEILKHLRDDVRNKGLSYENTKVTLTLWTYVALKEHVLFPKLK